MVHSKLTERYLTSLNDFYKEPTGERVVGKLFNFVITLSPVITPNLNIPVRKEKKATSSSRRYIRKMLASPR